MKKISDLLTNWYKDVKRELPWRDVKDPYLIWISEIILQQTRVAQGLDYYLRFVERFPTVESLALADEHDVLICWQGLGYYSRARNLHFAAKMIMNEFSGVFPTKYEDVRRLKGVGDYTAAAICSFAYDLPYSVVDGNVYRVLSRLFDVDLPIDSGEGKRYFADLAQQLLPPDNAAEHNQSMMEFGALHCVPSNPDCQNCVLSDLCLAFARNRVNVLPMKSKKTAVKNRYFNYFRVCNGPKTYIRKREEKDIWKNLYEFPLIETTASVDLAMLLETDEFKQMFEFAKDMDVRLVVDNLVHVLSHRRINVSFYEIRISGGDFDQNSFLEIEADRLSDYPVSQLTKLLIEF